MENTENNIELEIGTELCIDSEKMANQAASGMANPDIIYTIYDKVTSQKSPDVLYQLSMTTHMYRHISETRKVLSRTVIDYLDKTYSKEELFTWLKLKPNN